VRLFAAVLAVSLLTGCFGPFAAEPGLRFQAVFDRTNNLFVGSEVRILGVVKGQVLELEPEGDEVIALIEMEPDVDLPADVTVAVAPTSLLGERFLQLDPPYTGGPKLEANTVIQRESTSVAVDIDEVLHSFEKFLEGLDEETLAELVDVLAETLEGQGEGLNQLLDQGAQTVSVLRRSSDDLNGAVDQLADLNATVATRDAELGQLFSDLSVVMRTIADEGPQIIEGMRQLRRLTNELRPLTDEHADRLVTDLEILATSLSTVETNVERLGDVTRGGARLFTGAGRAIDYPNAMLRLDNEAENIPAVVGDRLINRLEGVCIRLGIDECSNEEFFEPLLPILTCIPNFQECEVDEASFGDAVLAGLNLLPKPARRQLERELRAEQRREERQRGDGSADAGAPSPSPSPTPGVLEELPLPSPRLQSTPSESLADRLARFLGGAR
jgi:virulence factor Mce-like protein